MSSHLPELLPLVSGKAGGSSVLTPDLEYSLNCPQGVGQEVAVSQGSFSSRRPGQVTAELDHNQAVIPTSIKCGPQSVIFIYFVSLIF